MGRQGQGLLPERRDRLRRPRPGRVGRRALSLGGAAALGLLLPCCSPAEEPLTAHRAGRLPEACHSLLTWNHAPGGPARKLFGELLGRGVPDLFLEGPGILAGWTDPETHESATVAWVELPALGEADTRVAALRARLGDDRVLEQRGQELWLLPKALAGFARRGGPRLDAQPWFAEGVAGLGRDPTDELEVEMHFDLRRLQDIARQTGRERIVAGLKVLPGIEGFLGLSLAFRPSVSAERGQIDLFVRLAAHPLGIAAALDVVPERLMPVALPGLDEASGFIRVDFRMGTYMDALKQRLLGGRGQAGEAVAGVSRTLGILLQNELWRGFGDEWVLVDPQGALGEGRDLAESGAYLAAALARAPALRASLVTLARAGQLLGGDIAVKDEPGLLVVDAELAGQAVVLAIGERIGGMGPQSARGDLLTLVKAAGEPGPPAPMADMPPAPPEARLQGLGRWSLAFLAILLPQVEEEFRPFVHALIGDGRRMRFQLWRVAQGFRLQGRW
ncbi:MAG: hypothetical protein R3F30_02425 [Planctomycetota bacterium]